MKTVAKKKKQTENKQVDKQAAMNDDQAVAGTPRSRDHCESVQLGGQAAAASNTVQT